MSGAARSDQRIVERFARAGALALAWLTVSPRAFAAPSALDPAIGYNYGQTETARIAGTGSALRAMSNSTSALFINPANMAATRVYHIGAFAQIWPQASRQSYGGAIVDSIVSSARLAGGFGGTWTRQDPDGVDRNGLDLRFALAYPFSDKFFVGAAIKYLSMKQEGLPGSLRELGPSAASAGLDDSAIVKSFTFDAGATLKPVPELALSLVGTNLSDPGHSFQPLTFGGGVGYGNEDFTIEADLLGDFTTYDDTAMRAMGGGEFLIAGHVPLRAGYRYDEGAESHAVTGGVGYVDTAYAIDVSVQRVVSGASVTVIVFGFTYHLESTGLTPGGGDF